MNPEGALVNTAGYSLFCRQWGSEGPVVVLIHGIPTHSYLWHSVAPVLAQNHRVLAVDLLGYGKSPPGPVPDLTLPRQAEHILALLDSLGIQQAHFVGHDLGGGIAQILAVYHSERVQSIAITDGVCFSNWPVPPVVSMRKPPAPAFEPGPMRVEEMLRLGTFNQEVLTPNILRAFTEPWEQPGGSARLQQAALALEHHQTEELVDRLPAITVPVSIFWGQYDRLLPAYWGWRLHEAIPGSSFSLLLDAGHFTMFDRPDILARELQQHLERAAPAPSLLAQVAGGVFPAVGGMRPPIG